MTKKQINLGLIGLGQIGQGVVKVYEEFFDSITQDVGREIIIKKIAVHNLKKHFEEKYPLTDNALDIINDPEIDLVVELIGGTDAAYTYVKQALINKKNVVTANKDLISRHGVELSDLAQKNKVDLFYDAAVGGGMPVLQLIATTYFISDIRSISGIINGTTNYILTKMSEDNLSYDEALKQAQESGFAESNPHNDVAGIDTAYKFSILARFAFGTNVSIEQMPLQGITEITSDDLEIAKQNDFIIKLIGQAKILEDKLSIQVGPMLVKNSSPFSQIRNEGNAVLINSELTHEMFLSGPGAGSLPTSDSVWSDIVHTARNIKDDRTGLTFNRNHQNTKLCDPEDQIAAFGIMIKGISEDATSHLEDWLKEAKIETQTVAIDEKNAFITTIPTNIQKVKKFIDQLVDERKVNAKAYQLFLS